MRTKGSDMEDESMYAADDSLMAFRCMDYDFIVPLADIARIAEKPPESAYIIGDGGGQTMRAYLMFNVGDNTLAICADEVYGPASIKPPCQFDMPDEAKSPDNSWIFGVADRGGGKRPAFLINCRALLEKVMGDAEE